MDMAVNISVRAVWSIALAVAVWAIVKTFREAR